MTEITALPQKMVDRRIIVLKSRLDPTMVRLLGEKVKRKVFTRLGFLKPSHEEIRLISVDKYYEPYLVLGGRYAIDYCRKDTYHILVDENVQEVAFLDRKLKPEPLSNLSNNAQKVVKLNGVEFFHYEDKVFLILDRLGREIDSGELPRAPTEEKTVENLKKTGVKFAEVKISTEEEIDTLRSRFARPSDVGEVVREILEINERLVIYCPTYQLEFRSVKTGKEAIAKLNGITGRTAAAQLKEYSFMKGFIEVQRLEMPPIEKRFSEDDLDLSELSSAKGSLNDLDDNVKTLSMVCDTPQTSEAVGIESKKKFPAEVSGEVFHVGDNVTAVIGDLEIPSGTTVFETLVVKGRVKIGADSKILGTVKALKDVVIGANATIKGNVVSGQNVFVGPNSVIRGSVESTGNVEIDENVIVERGLYSDSSVTLNRHAKVLLTLNAAKGISVV